MIKKKPYGKTLKDQLKASAKDRLYNFLLADGAIRGVIMHGTRMVNEMRANHELGILETLVLGRRGLSRVREFFLGSVSTSVVREARGCAVCVVE